MLRGGTYYPQILITENDTKEESFIDKIENAFTINVISSDFWKSGKTIRERESAIIDGRTKT